MAKIPVESSDLSDVKYDEGARTLRVWFHSGGVYEYREVAKETYDGLMSAESHGKYFHRHIKDRHDHTKLS